MALEYTPGAGGAQQAAVYTPGMAAQGSGNQDPLAMLDGYESVIILQDVSCQCFLRVGRSKQHVGRRRGARLLAHRVITARVVFFFFSIRSPDAAVSTCAAVCVRRRSTSACSPARTRIKVIGGQLLCV